MRQFVVIGRDVPVDPDAISLSDVPGAGRLDVLCRCVSAGVFLSHGIRESVRVHLVIDDAFTATFDADLRPFYEGLGFAVEPAEEPGRLWGVRE